MKIILVFYSFYKQVYHQNKEKIKKKKIEISDTKKTSLTNHIPITKRGKFTSFDNDAREKYLDKRNLLTLKKTVITCFCIFFSN